MTLTMDSAHGFGEQRLSTRLALKYAETDLASGLIENGTKALMHCMKRTKNNHSGALEPSLKISARTHGANRSFKLENSYLGSPTPMLLYYHAVKCNVGFFLIPFLKI